MNVEELAKRKLEIEGEIRLAEKQRDQILDDLTRIDSVKKDELKYHQDKIKKLTDEIGILQEKRDGLQTDIRDLNKTYQTTKEDIKTYSETEIKKAHDEVQGIYQTAERTRKSAEDKETDVNKAAENVAIREADVNKRDDEVKRHADENTKESERLTSESQALEKRKNEAEQAISQAKETVYTLEGRTRQESAKLRGLELTIKIKEEWIANAEKETKATQAEANRVLIEANAMKKANEEKEVTLQNQETYLKDRRASLERAVDEFVKKGGVFNG